MNILRWFRTEPSEPVTEEMIDRRQFTRRLFAIGAGIAVGGELIRNVSLKDVAKYTEREYPIYVTRAGGVASIPEGGYEAVPYADVFWDQHRRRWNTVQLVPYNSRGG